MSSLKRMLIQLLASFGGAGTAAIGGLPGSPKSRSQKGVEAMWVDWGGSHLDFPEIQQSQQAFEQGIYNQAYDSLHTAQQSIKIESPTFESQLFNNLAVSAYNYSETTNNATKRQRLRNEAQEYITSAAQIGTSSLELSSAITYNLNLIGQKR